MMCFMMWMSGSTVHIFSMMSTFTGLVQPLTAIAKSGAAFKRFQDPEGKINVFMPQVAYCAIFFGGFLFAIWKLGTMGLLPTYVSDWVSSLPPPAVKEWSAGGYFEGP